MLSVVQKTGGSRRASRARQQGGTLLGLLLGVVLGLGVAAAAAYFIYQAPMPFTRGQPANGGENPPATVQMVPATPTPSAPAPEGGLIDPNQGASRERVMPQVDQGAGTRTSEVSTVDVTREADARNAQAPATAPAEPVRPVAGGNFMLQAGSFRHPTDAETMKLRLALNGLEAHVVTAQVNGQTMYRVRLGPYESLDAVNQVRAQLAEDRIEAAVIRLRNP